MDGLGGVEVRQSNSKKYKNPYLTPCNSQVRKWSHSLPHPHGCMCMVSWHLNVLDTKLHRRCHSINRLSTMDTVTIEHGYVCELHPVGHKTNDCLLVRWFGINLLTSCIEPSILWMLFLARGNIVQNKKWPNQTMYISNSWILICQFKITWKLSLCFFKNQWRCSEFFSDFFFPFFCFSFWLIRSGHRNSPSFSRTRKVLNAVRKRTKTKKLQRQTRTGAPKKRGLRHARWWKSNPPQYKTSHWAFFEKGEKMK